MTMEIAHIVVLFAISYSEAHARYSMFFEYSWQIG